MSEIKYIDNHEQQMRDRLPGHITGGTFEQVIAMLGRRYQAIEDVLYSMIEARQLAHAVGWALDEIGKAHGVPRPNYGEAATNDDVYRILIYGQIAGNVSYGTAPDLYNVLGALGFTNVSLMPVYPASYTVSYTVNPLVADYLTAQAVKDILIKASHPIAFDVTAATDTPFVFEGNMNGFGFDIGQFGDGA